MTCAMLLAFIPSVVLANVGTPLMWASAFHLLLGNALLGLFEGWLLARAFGLPSARCIGLMIPANYFSAWLGMFIVNFLVTAQEVDIYNALRVTLAAIFATYLLTIVLEWPFVALCFARQPRWLRRSAGASLLVQTVSYILLFGGFWLLSGRSLYTEMTIVPAEQLRLPAGVQVFFIADADGDVYRLRQDEQPTHVFCLQATDVLDHLEFQLSADNAQIYDLVASVRKRNDAGYTGATTVVLPHALRKPADLDPMIGRSPRIGAATASPWRFHSFYWNTDGMSGSNERTGERLNVALGTPFLGLPMWSVIHLPEEKVLFQLGWNQLCLLDVATKRVALIARGRGPVAAADEDLLSQSP